MIKMNPLNHNWLDFMILSGLTLHQFKKKTAVNINFYFFFQRIKVIQTTGQRQLLENKMFKLIPTEGPRLTWILGLEKNHIM